MENSCPSYPAGRKVDGKGAAFSHFALNRDLAAICAYERLADGQPEADAFGFRCKQRLKDLLKNSGFDAGPRIFNCDPRLASRLPGLNRQLSAALRHRLKCISHEIENNLPNLSWIGNDFDVFNVLIDFNRPEIISLQRIPEQFIQRDLHGIGLAHPREIKKVGNNFVRIREFLLDDSQVLTNLRISTVTQS